MKRAERVALLIQQLNADGVAFAEIERRSKIGSSTLRSWLKRGGVKDGNAQTLLDAFGVHRDFLHSDAHGMQPHFSSFPARVATVVPELEEWLSRMGDRVSAREAQIMRAVPWRKHADAMYIALRPAVFIEAWANVQRIASEPEADDESRTRLR